MEKAEVLRREFYTVSKRLQFLVKSLQDEEISIKESVDLQIPERSSLSLHVKIYDAPGSNNEEPEKPEVKQASTEVKKKYANLALSSLKENSVTIDLFGQQLRAQQIKEPNQIAEVYKKVELIDQTTQTKFITQEKQFYKSQLIVEAQNEEKSQDRELFYSPQSQNLQNNLFNDSRRHFLFKQEFNLTPEPVSRLFVAQSKQWAVGSRKKQKCSASNSPLKRLNKTLADTFMKRQRHEFDCMSTTKVHENQLKRNRKNRVQSINLRNKVQTKSQSPLNKPFSRHDKCKYQTIVSQLNNNSSILKNIKLGKTIDDQHRKTDILIDQIRKYLENRKIKLEQFRHIQEKNKSFFDVTKRKIGDKSKPRSTRLNQR